MTSSDACRYANQPGADLAIWMIDLAPGAAWTLPPAAGGAATRRTVRRFNKTGATVLFRRFRWIAPVPAPPVVVVAFRLDLGAGGVDVTKLCAPQLYLYLGVDSARVAGRAFGEVISWRGA